MDWSFEDDREFENYQEAVEDIEDEPKNKTVTMSMLKNCMLKNFKGRKFNFVSGRGETNEQVQKDLPTNW